jgi:hypothetical protein
MALPAVVQSACNGNTAGAVATLTFTFGAAPAPGDLMVAVVAMTTEGGVVPVGANGWTVQSFTTGGGSTNFYEALFYKYAGASEPAVQVLEATATKRHIFSIAAWEVDNVSGTWATDFVAFHSVPPSGPGVTGTPLNTTSFNNELLLIGCTGYCGTGSATLTSSIGTLDSSHTSNSGDGFGVIDIASAYELAEPTSGTAIVSTLTMSANNNTNIGYGIVELAESSSPGNASGALGSNLTIGDMTATAAGASSGAASGALGSNLTIGTMTGMAVVDAVEKASKVVAYAPVGRPDNTLVSTKVVAGAVTGPPDASLASPKVVAYAVLGPAPPRRPTQVRVNWSR